VNGGKGCLTIATKAAGDNLGEVVAVCTDEEIMSGDAQANARLISAAPELLDAVRLCYTLIRRDGIRPDIIEGIALHERAEKAALAAIAKATGKELAA